VQIFSVKILRRLLLAVIAGVLAAVVVNYAITWRSRGRTVEEAPEMLGADVLRSVQNIEYTERRSGKVQFRLRAEELRETRGGKSLLRGIEAEDVNPDGSVRNRIRSREAEYDRESRQALFVGDVLVRMGQAVELRTESLHYDLAQGLGSTEDPVALESPEIQGSARGLRFQSASGNLELKHEPDFHVNRVQVDPTGTAVQNSYRVTAQSGSYLGEARLFRFERSVRLEGAETSLSADIVEVHLSKDEERLEFMFCEGNAVYESQAEEGTRTFRGQTIRFDIADSGAVGGIQVRRGAQLLQLEGGRRQELRGEEITLEAEPDSGRWSRLSSRGDVRFHLASAGSETTVLEAQSLESRFARQGNAPELIMLRDRAAVSISGATPQAGQELRAAEIRMDLGATGDSWFLREMSASGGVRWTSAAAPSRSAGGTPSSRLLESDHLRLRYTGPDSRLQGGAAGGDVRLVLSDGGGAAAPVRRLKCDAATFEFAGAGGKLRSFRGEGHVEVHESRPAGLEMNRPAQESRSASTHIEASFAEPDGALDEIRQWGDFRYWDDARRASAEQCRYSAGSGKLILTGSPEIWDESGHTRAIRFEYDRSSRTLTASSRVRTALAAAVFHAAGESPGSRNSRPPSIIAADLMEYRPEFRQVDYHGNVHLLSEFSQLQADSLSIREGGETVTAAGNVRHLILQPRDRRNPASPMRVDRQVATRITSPTLQFSREKNAVRYHGGVRLESEDILLSAMSLEAFLLPGSNDIERALAIGEVRIQESGRAAEGDRAEYLLNPGQFLVSGNPATIIDPGRGRSAAPRLTFFTSDDRILLEKGGANTP